MAGVVVAVAFFAEAVIMLVVAWSSGFSASALWLTLIDATVLSVVMVPVVWLLLVRPISRLAEQRGVLLGRLFAAQDKERSRLAREIHDELGQELTAIRLGLQSIDSISEINEAKQRSAEVGGIAASCIESVRRLSHDLSPQALEAFGLAAALERLAKEFSAAPNLKVTLQIDPSLVRQHPLTETAIFRIVQESLTNVVRHADASEAQVVVSREPKCLRIVVRDNGVGMSASAQPDSARSIGLQGMRERAESLGGWLKLCVAPGGGLQVVATLPSQLPDEPADDPYPDH